MKNKKLIWALPKGRMIGEVTELLSATGIAQLSPDIFETRSLFLPGGNHTFIPLKPRDIGVFVEKGAADLGIIGEDLLREYEPDVDVLLDLKIGKAQFVFAGPENSVFPPSGPFKIATKYPNITRKILQARGIEAEIVILYGSVEVAPGAGLADFIADLTSTGKTLKENNLKVVSKCFQVTSHLCANRASLRFKYSKIREVIKKLEKVVK